MLRRVEKDWYDLDLEQVKRYMRYNYKSSALYRCGKNVCNLTTKEKFQIVAEIFENFYNIGYSKYGYLFSNLFKDAFKGEINEIGNDRIDKYISRYAIKSKQRW